MIPLGFLTVQQDHTNEFFENRSCWIGGVLYSIYQSYLVS